MKKILPLALTLLATGCATYPPPSHVYYQPYEIRREVATQQFGVVESVRHVLLQGPVSGAGAISGGILGGAAGHAIGHGSHDVGAVTAIGVLMGSLIGSAIEADSSRRQGVEIRVQMDDGRLLVFVQEVTSEWFQPGDRVRVIEDSLGPRLSH